MLQNEASRKEEPYIAPKILSSLKNKDANPQVDWYKSDIFSLGLCLLEAATLKFTAHASYFQNYDISAATIDQLLNLVQSRYTNLFHSFLCRMLEFKEELRPSVEELIVGIESLILETKAQEDVN